jgi:hypothetical protein
MFEGGFCNLQFHRGGEAAFGSALVGYVVLRVWIPKERRWCR